MPKFKVEVDLTVKALFTTYPAFEVEAESEEAAEKYVNGLLNKLEDTGHCEELAKLDYAFNDPLYFNSCDYDSVEIDTLEILSIKESV